MTVVGQIQDPTFAEPTKSLGFAYGWSPELHDDLIGRGQLGVALSSGHLIGRSRECRALDNLLDSVRDGHSGVLVVRGEAGSGKSALLQHLISSAGGFRIVSATGVESEMELPFAGLHQLCLSMLDDVDSLPAPQRDAAHVAFGLQPGAAPDRLLIGLGLLNLLSAVAEEKPLLCIVDDAQWLDRASIDALTFVSRRLLADQVALVFSTRLSGTELSDFTELTVEGLSEGDAQALLNSVLHVAIDDRVRDRIIAETHGNPLALVEWTHGRTPQELAGGFGMPAPVQVSGQIEDTFRQRVAELPIAGQRFLTLAAAEPTGDPVLLWRAAAILGITTYDASSAMAAGLVEVGARVWFRHPLVRSAAYNSATLADRQASHRALADATDNALDPDRRAWHQALGSPGPNEGIAVSLERSADRAQRRGGLAASAALLERSVSLTLDPSRRTERILAAAAAHLDAGSFEAAVALLSLVEAEGVDDTTGALVDSLRGKHAATGGDLRGAPELFLRAARCFESSSPGLAQETYLAAMASAAVAGEFGPSVTHHEVALAASTCPKTSKPSARESLVAGLAMTTLAGPAAAAPTLRRVLEATDVDTIASEAFHWLSYLAAAAAMLWDDKTMHRISMLQITATRELGALTMLPGALNTLAHVLSFEGDLDGAASAIAEANEVIEATGGNVSWAGAVVAGWRGDASAVTLFDELVTHGRAAGNALAVKSALWGSARYHNGIARYERALTDACAAAQQPWQWGAQNHYPELIEAAVRCGQPTIGHAQLELLGETVVASGSAWGLGVYARSSALLTDGDDAEALYNEAIDQLTRSAMRSELARAHLLYGEWLRRENRRVDARAQLRVAYDMLSVMGIQHFAERARIELGATGESVRKRTVESFDELTLHEANIARLAADGRTNPEIGAQLFLSPRTVEWHLRKVFTKVGVTSRRELRDALPKHRAGAAG